MEEDEEEEESDECEESGRAGDGFTAGVDAKEETNDKNSEEDMGLAIGSIAALEDDDEEIDVDADVADPDTENVEVELDGEEGIRSRSDRRGK